MALRAEFMSKHRVIVILRLQRGVQAYNVVVVGTARPEEGSGGCGRHDVSR